MNLEQFFLVLNDLLKCVLQIVNGVHPDQSKHVQTHSHSVVISLQVRLLVLLRIRIVKSFALHFDYIVCWVL